MAKPKMALYWCSSCGGCEESVVDLAEDILNVAEAVDIVFWPVAMDFKYKDVEAMNDGEIMATLINGAVRMDEQEHMAKVLRKKSKLIIAHGACAHLGGVVGLANFYKSEDVLNRAYKEVPTVKNPQGILPKVKTKESGREVELSGFHDSVKALDQVVEVDYYIPGCPPTPELIKNAITAILEGRLPPKGSVLADKKAICHTCPRRDSKLDKVKISEFKRLYETEWDPTKCFLDQGIICLGPATRGGCGERCIKANVPCRGCFGPTDNVIDQGAKSLCFLASIIDSRDEEELKKIADSIPDPAGLFYRYSLASSMLKKKNNRGDQMSTRITIDPVTRLEGHGKIDIFLDHKGDVERTYFQVPEYRGFEKFCEGRAAEEMPTLTQKICGVCPTAHHTASSKALDDLFKVEPPEAAKKVRELMFNAFMFEDHLLHFYFLGGPDFIVGPDAPKEERNIFGVIGKVGVEIGKKIIGMRKRVRGLNATISGSPLYPVCGLPGGISKSLSEEDRANVNTVTKDAVEFAKFTLNIFDDLVLKNKKYVDLMTGDVFYHRTYYMGLVDEKNKVNFYDGKIRVVDPDGREFIKFEAKDYLRHLEEHVEPWSYLKILYIKDIGWKGFIDGRDSGIYRVAPLARLNASDGMATPLAQAEYERMFDTLQSKPVHNTLAYHWARLIEVLYAAERMDELARDGELSDPKVRNIPNEVPKEGVGVCEAPRGTLFHHYETDEQGILQKVNLLVATQNNAAAICMSIEKAARRLIKGGNVSDGILNMIEMALRAYDPCLACATHSLPGEMPIIVSIYDKEKKLIKEIKRD